MVQTKTKVKIDQEFAGAKFGDDQNQPIIQQEPLNGREGGVEREPTSLAQAKEASLESAAIEVEKIKAELAEQVPEHDKHLESDDLSSIGAISPLKEAEKVIESQTVSIPISQFELEHQKSGSLEDSIKWMKTMFLLVFKKAKHLGRRVVFGKTPN
jgi:hypothetical protein